MVKERAVIVSQKCIGTDIYDMVLSFPKGAKKRSRDSSLPCTVRMAQNFCPGRSVSVALTRKKEHSGSFTRIAGEGNPPVF